MKRRFLTAFLMLLAIAPLANCAEGDAAVAEARRGKLLFLQCGACHSIVANAPAGVGPSLLGIVGRKSAALPEFNYSPALRQAGLTWDEATLDRWLQGPNQLVPGNNMVFAGLPKPEDRHALITYLQQLKPAADK